jgi:S-adenosylmethionine hydrolase
VAAYLSLGIKPEAFGERTDTWVQLDLRKPEQKAKELAGEILHGDVFGNLITSIDGESLSGFTRGRPFLIRVGRHKLRSLRKGYWEGDKGEVIALIGSGGFLEISVREGNAQNRLKVKRGDPVRIAIENDRSPFRSER